jgi:2-hydroxy-3-oxopropionate reductase
MLTAGADVERVALGLDGLADGLAAASLLVDMSTIAPGMARSLAQRLGERAIDMLDAPVSGGGQAAVAASLAIMVGGKAAVLERARPLLALLGKTIVHVGDNGAGQVAKACNQMIMVGAIQAIAEALHFSARPVPIRPRCARRWRVVRPAAVRWKPWAGEWSIATSPPASKRGCITRTTAS